MPGKRWAATVTLMAVATALPGCGGDDGSDVDLSSDDPGRTPVTDTTSEELVGYAADEVTAYDEAVAAFKRSIRVGYRVYGEGEATPAARRALTSVYAGEELDDEWESLRDMEAEGGYFEGIPSVVRTKPVRILVSDDDATVDLRVCVDRSEVKVFSGESEITPQEGATPTAFKVTVDREADGTWRVSGGEEIGTC
jgi:hypothetical protein